VAALAPNRFRQSFIKFSDQLDNNNSIGKQCYKRRPFQKKKNRVYQVKAHECDTQNYDKVF
jgi:hypothetical protein